MFNTLRFAIAKNLIGSGKVTVAIQTQRTIGSLTASYTTPIVTTNDIAIFISDKGKTLFSQEIRFIDDIEALNKRIKAIKSQVERIDVKNASSFFNRFFSKELISL